MAKTDGTEIYYEYEDSEIGASNMKEPIKPIKMGRESTYWQRMQEKELYEEFVPTQQNEDLKALTKKEVSTDKQLFGIGNQYKAEGVSLDKKYQGEGIELDKKYDSNSPYEIQTDHMMPLIPPFSDLKLRYCTDFASGEVCVYRYRGENYCNQIKIENGRLVAHSLNPRYKPVVLDPQEYHFLAVIDSVHYFLKGRTLG
jgi:hypothetical protein